MRSRTAMSSSVRSLSDLRHVIESGKYGNVGTVTGTCGAVRKWLQANKDGYREFFRECYFPLVASVFGITSQGMLAHVGNRPAECDVLVTFLRPGGTLFQAMVEVDAESLNHCRLPTSHLPVHTQTLLCTKSGIQDLQTWPQYEAALASQVHDLQSSKLRSTGQLGVSPVSRASPGTTASAHSLPPTFISLPITTSFIVLMTFTCLTAVEVTAHSSLQMPSSGRSASPNLLTYASSYLHTSKSAASRTSPHLQLITSYIRAVLPQPDCPSETVAPATLAAQFLAVMLEMWLTDMDMPTPAAVANESPSSVATPRSLEARTSSHEQLLLSHFVPPMLLRTKCIKALAAHVYLKVPLKGTKACRNAPPAAPEPAHDQEPWLPVESIRVSSTVVGYAFHAPVHGRQPKLGLARLLGAAASPALQNVSAHMYRYIRRALTLWPPGQAKESLAEVIELWLVICFPWQYADPSHRYSPKWRNHVLAHTPFYLILFPLALELLIATTAISTDQAYRHLRRIAAAFGSEEELIRVLQDVELAANRCRRRLPVPVLNRSGITELSVLAPMLLQQAEAMERAALVAAVSRTDPPPSGALEFKFFVKEGTTYAPCHGVVGPYFIVGPHKQLCWVSEGMAVRSGAPGLAADILDLLRGSVSQGHLASLRSQLKLLELDRFEALQRQRQPDICYAPQCRSVEWGGPAHLSREQVPYIGNFLFRPAGTNEFHAIVKPLAQLSLKANQSLGLYEDDRSLALRPEWQRFVIARMHHKGWSVDFRQWAEFKSLTWIVALLVAWYSAAQLVLSHPVAIALSFGVLALVSALIGATALVR